VPGIRNHTIESLTLDVTEVAQMLGISKRTVYRLLDGGEIPRPIKLGNATRWRRSDIVLFVEAGSIRAFRRAKGKDTK
jgi:excisionase family DNA binding protein